MTEIVIDDFSERHHPFEGCFNFRDIGGYGGLNGRKVRWGRYFRAGRQDRMTQTDLVRCCISSTPMLIK